MSEKLTQTDIDRKYLFQLEAGNDSISVTVRQINKGKELQITALPPGYKIMCDRQNDGQLRVFATRSAPPAQTAGGEDE